MDVSGGSGQPRSDNTEPTEHPAGPTAPTNDAGPAPTDARAKDPDRQPPADAPAPEPATDTPPAPHEASQEPTTAAPTPEPGPEPPTAVPAPQEPTSAPHREPATDHAPAPGAGPEPTAGVRPADEAHREPGAEPSAAPESRPQPTTGPRADGEAHREPATGPVPEQEPRRQPGAGVTPAPDIRAEAVSGPRPASVPEARKDSPAESPEGDGRAHAQSGMAKGRPPQRPKEPGGGLLMGRPFGVPVYVAPSWFLVAALITWVFGGQLDRVLPELGAARYLVSLFFAVAFYASVLVHELAHTVAAIRFNLPVRRIQLQFFGGVSEIEKEAETPGREFVLAFVGPLLSLILSGVFYLAMQPVQPDTVPGVLLAGLMVSNLIVAAFNLLPGLPLDGGRMLRAVVWKITGRPMSGTVAAAWVGRALAISVLVGLPLLNQSGAFGGGGEDINGMDTVTDALLAAILAAIIWTGAGNSLRMARLREHLPELRARTLTRRAVPVETDTPLSEALRRANAAGARALVVVDADGTPLSLVREAAIVGVPEHRRPWVAVSGLAQDLTDGMRVSAELAGEDLLDVLRATPATEYLVVEETGEIYGVLSAADVERAFVRAMARPS
ncbi:site-2 protease family protein [Streptomyces sasae]|uniref:site-2 protease family protein n=1 Tax=Streptomyces sasae TaxID=1266772 RepID=UPI00292E37DA|nr:site-2 protease family protein [Streptomyces sasae]